MAYVEVAAFVTHNELGRTGPACTRIIDICDALWIIVADGDPGSEWKPLSEWFSEVSWEQIPA